MNPFQKLFSFRGRNGRGAYWTFVVLNIFILSAIKALFELAENQISSSFSIPVVLFATVLLVDYYWIFFAMLVKRCHDIDKSGWWALFSLIPIIGSWWSLIVLGFRGGDEGQNKYDEKNNKVSTNNPTINLRDQIDSGNIDVDIFPDTSPKPQIFEATPVKLKKGRWWLWLLLVDIGVVVILLVYTAINSSTYANSSIEGKYIINHRLQFGQTIWIINYETGERYKLTTSDKGVFRLDNIPSGYYYIGTIIVPDEPTLCVPANDLITIRQVKTDTVTNIAVEPYDSTGVFVFPNTILQFNIELACIGPQ